MTVAFAIQTHFLNDEVIALAREARSISDAVDLAIDADLSPMAHRDLSATLGSEIARRSRPVTWCGPSQVLALLDSYRRLLERPGWTHVVNLSGDTIPLRPLADLPHVLAQHYSCPGTIVLDAWVLRRPPILVERSGDAEPKPLTGLFRNLFSVTPELEELFRGESPVRHASTRFFVGCREVEGAKWLRLEAFDGAEIARRMDVWNTITPRCARAYYILTREQCTALIAAAEGEQRALFDLFLTSFEPDEAWLATLVGEMGYALSPSPEGAFLHHAGGKRAPLDGAAMEAIRQSGAFFVRRLRSDKRPRAEILAALAAT